MHGDAGRDLLARLEGKDVDQIRALGGASGLGDLIALAAVDLAEVREEEDVVMRGGSKDALNEILLLRRHAGHAAAAALLAAVGRGRHAFAVARVREREDALLLLNEILDVDLILDVLDLGQAVVAVLVADGDQLVLQNALEHFFVRQQLAVIFDALFELLVFRLELLAFESLQALELHVQHDLRLDLRQAEALHQALFRVVIALADGPDNLVDVVLRDQQTLQHVLPVERLFEVELRPSGDDLLLESEILVEHMAQGQDLRLLLVVDQCEHRHAEGRLHLRLGKEAVQNDLRVCVLFELDDDAHAVAVGLVANVGDALEPLVAHLLGHGGDELALVDLIRQLRHNDPLAVLAEFLKFGARTDGDLAAAGGVGGADAAAAHDDAPGREIRALDVLHQVCQLRLGIFKDADAGVDDLRQIVRRDIRRHADGDAARAVDQQVREAGREHARLFSRFVEVRIPGDRILVDVAQHLVAELRHARLGITVGRGRIAVDGAEVAVAVDQRVAHGEILRQTDHRVVDRRVAVRMIPAQHVADAGRRFFERLVGRQPVLIHGVENAPVHGLQTVAHIRQRTADNDGHRVVDIRALHLMHELRLHDPLLREHDVLGLIIFLMCHRTWVSFSE